ncbi:reverse transcriptase [Plakobranchus ocellatus]|uniref:Reverse transcriptase n=1 Tax=Plakobranchus ocellatus TaxID=259542 RepID=A0AAV4CGG9_9GAST|nr:reverse transcriptase [Plakobranchus ocellatus]
MTFSSNSALLSSFWKLRDVQLQIVISKRNLIISPPSYIIEKIQELEQGADKSWIQIPHLVYRVGARGFVGTSAYILLIKLSINDQRRTKALKALAETA